MPQSRIETRPPVGFKPNCSGALLKRISRKLDSRPWFEALLGVFPTLIAIDFGGDQSVPDRYILDAAGNSYEQSHLGLKPSYPTFDGRGRMSISFTTLSNRDTPLAKPADLEHGTALCFLAQIRQVAEHRHSLDM